MKSIQTKLIVVISSIIIVVILAFLITSTLRTNAILDDDSKDILSKTADYYANVIDDNFRSTEQSVGTIFNYANKRAETYTAFLEDEKERDEYTYDVSELGKSIAENTRGAMAVYLRYNPDDFGPISGFWYTINIDDNSWQPSVPTDMSLYDKDDLEHVGWYYTPIATGKPMWMDPYYNANLGVDMISYIIPYYYKGYTVGIIGMDISMDLLKESVANVKVYDTGRAFLIDKNGNVIYHEDYPDGISFENLPESDQQYFKNVLDLELNNPVVFRSRIGTQQKLVLKELKNGMILGFYAPIQEINAPQQSLTGQQLMISVVILLLAVLITLIWVRTITRPIKRMTDVAENYANGDFSEKMSVKGNDEIGILSRSLQTMSSSLQKQIKIADSANRAKSDFLANMSHEIRTPINSILGMNEMILHESTEKDIQEYSSNIQMAGKTLLSLVNTILDFSKIEDGKMEIITANYSTSSMINNLVISILERAKAKGLNFIADISETLPSTLCGDDIRIAQVIMNLLTNAVKYTEKGTVRLIIKEQSRDDNMISLFICVKDTGIGIKEEDLGKLFESFERLEEKRNRNIEGTGLGMAIVNKLLPMMGSELTVKSKYRKGSEFSFVLRQKIVDSTPIGNYVDWLKKSENQTKRKARLKIDGAKVLVVDDNEMNLKVAKNLLKLSGIIPDLASSGPEAIEKIRVNDYHIVFLDHMMPKMDGIEVLHKLREDHILKKETSVVALTANAIVGAKEMYLNAGFDDYLSKPIDLSKLEDMLVKYLPKELFDTDKKSEEVISPEVINIEKPYNNAPIDFPIAEVDADEPIEFLPEGSDEDEPMEFLPEGSDEDEPMEFLPEGSDADEPMEFPADDQQETVSKADDLKDFIEGLKEIGVNTVSGLSYSAEDRDLYLELVRDFADAAKDKVDMIRQNHTEHDINDYQVRVHALKSTAKMIGLDELSAMALEQEMAAKANNSDVINKGIDKLLDKYLQTASEIKSVLS